MKIKWNQGQFVAHENVDDTVVGLKSNIATSGHPGNIALKQFDPYENNS